MENYVINAIEYIYNGENAQEIADLILEQHDIPKPEHIDQEIQAKFQEFVEIQKELNSLKVRAEILSKRSDLLEKELMPIVKEAIDQTVVVQNAIIKYKERAHTSVPYKVLYDNALKKVNSKIKEFLLDLQAKLTHSDIHQYLDVKYEGLGSFINNLIIKFRNWIGSLVRKLSEMKSAVKDLTILAARRE